MRRYFDMELYLLRTFGQPIVKSIQQRILHTSWSRGMRLSEFRRRPQKNATENMTRRIPVKSGVLDCWMLRVGLDTYGPCAGLRASSFNNPPLGPPKKDTGFSATRERSAFGSLSIGAGNILITGDSETYDRHL